MLILTAGVAVPSKDVFVVSVGPVEDVSVKLEATVVVVIFKAFSKASILEF